jgi:hypothetical protein
LSSTQTTLLKLEGKDFGTLFTDNVDEWTTMAEEARTLMAGRIANGEPTVDDIKKVLLPLVEIHPKLADFMAKSRLTQKYWVGHFTDYVLHRVYNPKLETPKKDGT